MSARFISITMFMLSLSGCFLPVPHRRLHYFGLRGHVVDAASHQPIRGAVLTSVPDKHSTLSSATGEFTVKPVYEWHGAYLIGPISYSLLPFFDVPCRHRKIKIEAAGYRTEEFFPPSQKHHSSSKSFLDGGTIEMDKAR